MALPLPLHLPTRHEVLLGQRRVVYDEYGTGPSTVLLLHGIPGDRGCWREVAGSLATEHRVIVPDLPGFGESDATPPGFHAQEQQSAMISLLNALHCRTAHLVGFDFGGPIAVLMAAALPERVRSLTLASTNVFPDTPVPAPLRVARIPILGPIAYRLFFGRPGLVLMWAAATARRGAFPLHRYARVLRSAATVRSTRDVFLTSMRDLPGLYRPVQEALQSLNLAILVVWSDRDPFFSLDVGRRVVRECAQGELRVLEDTGHFTPLERAEEFAAIVAAHCSGADARASAAASPPPPARMA